MKKTIRAALFLCALIPLTSYSQKYYTKADMAADLDTLYAVIEEIHPDMFTVIGRKKFENGLDRIKGALPDSAHRLDYYKLVAPLVASLGDGHTRAFFPSLAYAKINPLVMPVDLSIDLADSCIVVTDNWGYDIPKGAAIKGLNGVPVWQVITDMLSFESGESMAFRASLINANVPQYLYLVDDSERFAIEYDFNGQSSETTLDAVRYSQWARVRNERIRERGRKNLPYSFSYIGDDTALFDCRSFDNDDRYQLFLDSMFTQLRERGIANLIVDLRKNGGGSSMVGDEILKYIARVPFKQVDKMIIKLSAPAKAAMGFGDEVTDKSAVAHVSEAPLDESTGKFAGEVYLLTSPATFSSASMFAACFKHYKMGTVIGEETGGWLHSFGDVYNGLLPKTGLIYGVSMKEFFLPGSTKNTRHGVIPDIEVSEHEALDKALEIIRAKGAVSK